MIRLFGRNFQLKRVLIRREVPIEDCEICETLCFKQIAEAHFPAFPFPLPLCASLEVSRIGSRDRLKVFLGRRGRFGVAASPVTAPFCARIWAAANVSVRSLRIFTAQGKSAPHLPYVDGEAHEGL